MADYLISAENKEQWLSVLPELLKTECDFDVNPVSWFGYIMGYSDGTWGRSTVEGSTMSVPYDSNINVGVPVFSIKDNNNPRFCGYLADDNTDDNTPVTITIEDGYITNNEQIYIYLNEYGNIKKLQNISAGFNNSVYVAPQSVEELGANAIISGTGTQERLNINVSGIHTDLFCLDSNIPIFDTKAHAQAYIQNGTKVGLLNGEAEDRRPTQYYFEEEVYRTDLAYNNKSQVARIKNYFDVNKQDVRMVRYTEKRANGYNNVVILASSSDDKVILAKHSPNATTGTSYRVSQFNILVGEYNRVGVDGEVVDGSYIYFGGIRSNIPYAKDRSQAESYLRNEITKDELPKYSNTAQDPYKKKWTGDDADTQNADITSNTYADGNLISQYIMSASQLDAVKNLIYATDTTTLEALKLALSSHGESFISDIIDCYHVPIDVTPFVSHSSVSHIPFGLYASDCSGSKVTVHGKIIELGSIDINGQYGDIRDYECVEMALYLPFCAIVPLPVDIFMNSTLTVKVGADLRSHNLRYYIFVNNGSGTSLYEYHDCAFGQNIALMGNDSSSRALTTMQTAFNIINTNRNLTFGNINTALSGGQGAWNQASSGNFIGAGFSMVNAVNKMEQDTQNAKASIKESKLTLEMTQAPRIFSGSQSSGLSENDILYPYILFSVQDCEIPSNMHKVYGKPCNVFDKLSKFSGFTQVDDARIYANIPSNEKEMLISALREGVIL